MLQLTHKILEVRSRIHLHVMYGYTKSHCVPALAREHAMKDCQMLCAV